MFLIRFVATSFLLHFHLCHGRFVKCGVCWVDLVMDGIASYSCVASITLVNV